MAFPIDKKGIFNVFTDFEYARPHKGAVVFLDCERILIQYEKNTGALSPGFIVSLLTEPGESYVLETKGFLHEGKRAFVYGEAKGVTGVTGSSGSSGPSSGSNGISDEASERLDLLSTPAVQEKQQVPTILGFLEENNSLKTSSNPSLVPAEQGLGPAGQGLGQAGQGQGLVKGLIRGETGCYGSSRIIPREYFFKTCEESCFKICFTALTHCTQVGVLFFNNTEDYCLSLTQFLVYRSSCCTNKTGCCVPGNCLACDNKRGTSCDPDYNPNYNPNYNPSCDPSCNPNYNPSCNPNYNPSCSPCNPYNYIKASDCCNENICIKTGPTGAMGPMGARGAPGVAGTRTFALNISRQGFAGNTLQSLDCAVPGTLFLEISVTPNQIECAFVKNEIVFSNCVKLWSCNGSKFQWIIPSEADYIYYDMDGLYLWIVLQNQTATLLRSNPGDLVVNSNNGDVLVGNSLGQWIYDGTNLKGPIGPTGEQGPIGPTGNPGIQGPQGPTGIPLGSASFVTDILPTDFVLIANNQGSLINFVPISLDTSSIPVGTILTSTFVNNFSTQRRLEIDMTINNVLFASPIPISPSEIGPGQHVCGVLTIDLSTYFINQGFFESFFGNPSIVAQVQQDDIAINRGYQNNIFSSLSNGLNQVKLVIVYYNPGPGSVDIITFQTLINLSVKISGIVSLTG